MGIALAVCCLLVLATSTLHYEVRGSGPVLAVIGSPMTASEFAAVADALAAVQARPDVEEVPDVEAQRLADALVAAIDPILQANAAQVAEYLGGKDKVFGFFVGQAMKALKGKANPEELQRVLRERLEARRTAGSPS